MTDSKPKNAELVYELVVDEFEELWHAWRGVLGLYRG
jgi:hypothetical protein